MSIENMNNLDNSDDNSDSSNSNININISQHEIPDLDSSDNLITGVESASNNMVDSVKSITNNIICQGCDNHTNS